MADENDASLPPIRLPSALLTAAKAQAARRDETVSQVVRRALRNYVMSRSEEAGTEEAASMMPSPKVLTEQRSDAGRLGRFFARQLGDSLSIPIRFKQFVADHPNLYVPLQDPSKSVGSCNVVQWHNWKLEFDSLHEKKGIIQVWSGALPGYGASWEPIDALENFTTETVTKDWSCDIAQISGLSASREKLERFATLDEMAETVFPEMLHPISEEQINNLLRKEIHREFLDITHHDKSSIGFNRYMWDDGRIYIANSVDMQPLIAARYIAKRLRKNVRLYGKLRTYCINLEAAKSLVSCYDVYTLPYLLTPDFLDAMRLFEAPYGVYGLPRGVLFDSGNGMARYLGASISMSPGENGEVRNVRLILLPKNHQRAVRVSKVLHAHLFDAGRFILDAARRQAKS